MTDTETTERYFDYTTLAPDESLRRTYSVTSRTWYASAVSRMVASTVVDEVTVGHYSSHGGTPGEFVIKLIDLEHGKPPAIQVCVFDDAWHMFHYESDLFRRLATLKNPTLADVETALQAEGFQDATPTTVHTKANRPRQCKHCRRRLIPSDADQAQIYCGRVDCQFTPS